MTQHTQILNYYKAETPVGMYYHFHFATYFDGEYFNLCGTINAKLEPTSFRVHPTNPYTKLPAFSIGKMGILVARLMRKELKANCRYRKLALSFIQAAVFTAIIMVVGINWLAYPECNRDTRDCFLIQHLWSNNNERQ